MRFDSVLLLVLMFLKIIFLVPLVYEQLGVWHAMSALLVCLGGYGVIIYCGENECRSVQGGMAIS